MARAFITICTRREIQCLSYEGFKLNRPPHSFKLFQKETKTKHKVKLWRTDSVSKRIYGEILEVGLDPFNTETKANYLYCSLQQEEDHYWPVARWDDSQEFITWKSTLWQYFWLVFLTYLLWLIVLTETIIYVYILVCENFPNKPKFKISKIDRYVDIT